VIAADRLTYDYPGQRALDQVSFSLAAASITALVGPNGAGKTTLLRCIAGLDEPYSGSIEVAGIDVLRRPRDAHRQLGYLPDHFGLYAELSVRQCLLHAGRARGLKADGLEMRVLEVAAQLDIDGKLDDKAGSLSRGQRQRLAIAQAIIHRPRVLLLDEPASGLDPESRAALSGLMRRLRDEGMTLIVSSHILAELEEYCTGMLVLQQGRVVEHRVLAQTAQVDMARSVRVRLSRPTSAVRETLAAQGITAVSLDTKSVTFAFSGGDDALASLLQSLLAAGLPVCEFGVEETSLQDVYLKAVEDHRAHP
jgi:ABC-2 type transport system ATP-binding protein